MAKRKRTRRFNDIMKLSLYFVFLGIIAICVFLIGRMVWINNNNGDEYARKVLSQQAYASQTLVAERGMITDRNGITLARSEKTYNVIIDPDVILSHDYYMEPTLLAMETCLGYDRETMTKLINDNAKSRYLVYEKNIEYTKVSDFNSYKSKHKFVVGVWFEEEYTRV